MHTAASRFTAGRMTGWLVILTVACCATPVHADDSNAQVPSTPGQLHAPAYVPNVPKEVSRPAGWPSSVGGKTGDAAGKPVDNHVLSSIRKNPGAPLEPFIPGGESGPAASQEILQAAYEEAASATASRPMPQLQSLETALVVARVGPEVVLESDLLTPKALEWLDKVSPGMQPEQIRELRMQICQQVIDQHIETLLIYVDACREIPEDKLPEIRKNVDKAFDEQFLPKLMKEANVANSLEYEQQLRAKGQSLDRMRKMFFERGLAQEWMRKNVKTDDEIAHADMIAWYQNHLAEYDFPAKARFESLTVKTGLKRSRQEGWNLLAAMGNEVLAGREFAEVARARSEGPTADQGGVFDWTNKGSLASKKLDEAIFSLPIGQLSSIIEDETALHIVRVIERTDAGRTPFLEAQVGIKQALYEERQRKASDEYLAKLQGRTPVWTVFDDKPGRAITAGRPAATTTR
jgi:hypothetical protein